MTPKPADRLFSKKTQTWIWFAASLLADVLSRLLQAVKENAEAWKSPWTWLLIALGVVLFLRQTFGEAPGEES